MQCFYLISKSDKTCKYVEYCLQLRPFNAYLHYQYATYLSRVVKNYELAYYHMKLTKKLQPDLFLLQTTDDRKNAGDAENTLSSYDARILQLAKHYIIANHASTQNVAMMLMHDFCAKVASVLTIAVPNAKNLIDQKAQQ